MKEFLEFDSEEQDRHPSGYRPRYDVKGYNREGYNKEGYNREGYNLFGFNLDGKKHR